jgi:hypothetical protein
MIEAQKGLIVHYIVYIIIIYITITNFDLNYTYKETII